MRRSRPARGSHPAIEIDALDRKIDPCTDFYQFACGGWIAKNPVPADRRSYGRFAELQERNFTLLRRILESARRDTAIARRPRDFYAACMDEPTIEAAGPDADRARPRRPSTRSCNPDDLPVLDRRTCTRSASRRSSASARRPISRTRPTRSRASIRPGSALPDRDYYLKTDQRSAELREQYVARDPARCFTLAGRPAEQAAADAKAVLSIETALATAMLDRVKRRDPANTQHHMAINELQALSPNFNWRKYAAASEAPQLLRSTSPSPTTCGR